MKNQTYFPLYDYEEEVNILALNQSATKSVEIIANNLGYTNVKLCNYDRMSRYGEDNSFYGTRLTMEQDDKKITCYALFEDCDLEDTVPVIYLAKDAESDAIPMYYVERDLGLDYINLMNQEKLHTVRILL